jgi:membrane fusion protein, heavy metal efflux system
MKRDFCLFAALLVMSCFIGCAHDQKPSSNNQPPLVIKTVRVEPQNVDNQLAIPARVQPDPALVVRVYPPAGGRLLRVNVLPGDRVRKGDVVAVLESADVAQARSDYAKAKTESGRTLHALDRAKLLFDHKVLSQREYEDADANYQEARSELERSADRLRVLGAPLQEMSSNQVALVAPHDGVVIDLGAAPGELSKSTDNANPICTIADLSSVWIIGDIYEKDLEFFRRGEPVDVTVAAFPDRHWSGKLAVISDTLDPTTRTLKARVVLANSKRELKPEMFATIRVSRPMRQAIVLPASALLREGGDTAVMVETTPGKYERRLVSLASSNANNVVIVSGLQPGDVVVSEGAALLRGGGEQ